MWAVRAPTDQAGTGAVRPGQEGKRGLHAVAARRTVYIDVLVLASVGVLAPPDKVGGVNLSRSASSGVVVGV